MWTVDPKIPLGLWWALVAVALVVIVSYVLRRESMMSFGKRFGLGCLLAVGLAGPLWIALNPTWVETIPPLPGDPTFTVLIDGSMSMGTADTGQNGTKTRWQQAVELSNQLDPGLSKVKVVRKVFNNRVVPFPDENEEQNAKLNQIDLSADEGSLLNRLENWPNGHRTDLAAALRESSRTGSLGQAILMISDGAHNANSVNNLLQAAREAKALSTPIYTLTIGTSVGMKNLSVVARAGRMIAFPDRPLTIRVQVAHNGLAGMNTELGLWLGNEQLQSKTIRLTDDPNQEVSFTLESGVEKPLERFRIMASEVRGEVTNADNQTAVLVQKLTAPIQVLVLEGKPYWDSKFLGRNLSRDPIVDLTSIVQVGNGRFLKRRISAVPDSEASEDAAETGDENGVSRDEWSIVKDLASPLDSRKILREYRVVMLGRDSEAFLTEEAIENLRTWIATDGGCLLCSRGAPMSQISKKLAEILPVRWGTGMESHFRSELSDFGLDSSVFEPLLTEGDDPLSKLPPLSTQGKPTLRRGLPQVLVQSMTSSDGRSLPVVTYQPYGAGQSVVVEGAGMWRWAFLPPQHAEKDDVYPTLWQALLQWIVSQQDVLPGQEIAVRPDRANFISGDQATASVVIKDPSAWPAEGPTSELSGLLQSSTEEGLPTRVSLVPSNLGNDIYRLNLGKLPVGYYSLNVVSGSNDQVRAATAFEVRDPWFESLEVDARPDLMRKVSSLSEGAVVEPEEIDGLVESFADRLKQDQRHEEQRTPLWDRPWIMLVVLSAWLITWTVRRQGGLT